MLTGKQTYLGVEVVEEGEEPPDDPVHERGDDPRERHAQPELVFLGLFVVVIVVVIVQIRAVRNCEATVSTL